ncbi:MAG: TOBE domain-containing protein [Lachnospiraceae bacterium]|jgi:molybdate transport system regulatory protein
MISARNQIEGTVREVVPGAVNGIVKIDAAAGNHVSATISMEAINQLGLKPGVKCKAIIKATEVMMANDYCKISARNQFKGTIASVTPGAVNAIVKLDVPGGIGITSTISLEAVKELGLKAGDTAVAIVKATSVMVAVD